MPLIEISARAGETLKEVLLPDLAENFWRLSNHPLLRLLGMEKDETPGKGAGTPLRTRIRIPSTFIGRDFEVEHLHTSFGGGVHATAENVTLRSGKFGATRSSTTAKFIQGSFQISRQTIAATRDKKFALVKEITQNAMGAMHSVHFNLNRMFVGASNGTLAVVNGAVSAATTINVDNAGTEESPPTQHINVDDELLIGTTAEIEAGTAESVTVASVTDDNTFEATTNETLVDNDLIVRADVYAGAAYQEVTGLTTLVNNTGTVQGLNKATNSFFASPVSSGVGTLALTDIDAMNMRLRRFSLDPSALFLICNSTQWRRIASLYTVTRNFDVDGWSGNLVGGFTGLRNYGPDGQQPIFIDDMVEDGRIYIVDPNSFYWAEMHPFGFTEDALSMEGIPGQRLGSTLNYEFAFWLAGELVQTNARASGALTGITGPSV